MAWGMIAASGLAMGDAAPPVVGEAQRASLPALSVQGIARVAILCLVVDRSPDRLALQARLCEQARRISAERATVPVATIGFGDPALLARDTLGVLVHAAIDRRAGPAAMVLSVRPYRADATRGALFGATPVVARLDARGLAPDAVLADALDQILPWRMATAR